MVRKEEVINFIMQMKVNLKKIDELGASYQKGYEVYLNRIQEQIRVFNLNKYNIRIRLHIGEFYDPSLVVFLDNRRLIPDEKLLSSYLQEENYDLNLENEIIIPYCKYSLVGRQPRG